MGTSSNNYSSLVDATSDLKERGYTSDFKLVSVNSEECSDDVEENALKSLATEKRYINDQVKVREHYRFEGPSNPDDMSVLYAVECEGGEKGLVIDAYGTYSSQQLSQFMLSVPIETDPSQDV